MAANVKVLRYIGPGSKAITKAKDHIKYMEVNREHHRNNPHLFTADQDHVRRQPFLKRLEEQRTSPRHAVMHKMIITLSEKERNELKIDLKELARDTISRLEGKIDRHLDWVATVHDDKGHPHVHIAFRGRDQDGKPIFIGKHQIRQLREIADQEKIRQAERTLGPERAQKIMERLEREAEKRRNQPDHSLAKSIVNSLTFEFQQMIQAADQEREIEQARARHKMERKAKQKKKQQTRGIDR